jgi:hypothetical protein
MSRLATEPANAEAKAALAQTQLLLLFLEKGAL